MKREEIEMYAFLYFGSGEDRDLLMGKKPASYQDFSRLVYLAGFFKLHAFLQKLWEMFGKQFCEKTKELEDFLISGEKDCERIDEKIRDSVGNQEQWILDFCEHTQSWKKKRLREIVDEICRERGIYLEGFGEDA